MTSHGTELLTPRSHFSTTQLSDGRILFTGGDYSSESRIIEFYNPVTQSIELSPGTLKEGRFLHTSTLLPDGKILIAGGQTLTGPILSSIEILEPQTNNSSLLPISLNPARGGHSATLLPDGKVLLAGGSNGSETMTLLEIFNPVTKT